MCTVKLVYKDHRIDHEGGPYTQVVFTYRFNTAESISLGICKCVFIRGGL